MKLILFLVIIVITMIIVMVYFMGTKLNNKNTVTENIANTNTVTNTNTNKTKMKSMSVPNNVKYPKKINNYGYDFKEFTKNLLSSDANLPSTNKLISMIKSAYLDKQFKFNIANQPVTSRQGSMDPYSDKKYIEYIKKNIANWNEIIPQKTNSNSKIISPKDVKIIFVKETEREFYIKTNTEIIYQKKPIYFELAFYGQIEKSYDFFKDSNDTYIIQLVEMCELKTKYNDNHSKIITPFMSMDEQLAYVNKVHALHKEETY